MVKFYDTMLGEYISNPGLRDISLDKLSGKYFSYNMMNYDYVTQKGKKNFQEVDLPLASIFSGEKVYIINSVFQKQKKDFIFDNKILQNIELPLISVLKDMEIAGVKIDRNKLKEIGLLLENEIKSLEKKIYTLAGENFNINSPKQVSYILFEKFHIPKLKKNKTGFSVNAQVLEELSFDYEIVRLIVEYRHYSKLFSTYVNGFLDLLDEDDFLYTNYNQTITSTGRLSSTNPNLQNIPTGNGISGSIREAFISRFNGGKILSCDYSQIELRIAAIISGDLNLIKTFNLGLDIHKETAKKLFPDEKIGTKQRKIAKGVNFGILYGISAFGLSKNIGKSMKESQVYIDTFFKSYPLVGDYIKNTIKFCEENSFVETLFGRKRFINSINDSNKIIRNSAQREAINMPIQGTCADIIKLAMIGVYNFLKNSKYKSKMIMQVHDELVFDVFPGEQDFLIEEIAKIMQKVLNNLSLYSTKIQKKYLLDLKVDIGIGNTWKDSK